MNTFLVTSLLDRYRRLPRIVGVAFLPIGFLARLPMSMIQLGTVLLISTATGSLAYAGLTAGALAVGSAVGGPLMGWLADRHGQRLIITTASLLNALFAIALVIEVAATAGRWLILVTAIAIGGSTPPIGPLIRSRWVALTGGGPDLSTAMSYEGAADEVAYVVGPAVVSLLALISPPIAMVGAAVLVGVFGSWVGLHRTARITVPVERHRGAESVVRNPVLAKILLMSITVGAFFGGTQTGVTAVATLAGTAGSAGLIYSAMAISSAVAGLATSALPARFALVDRLTLFASWLAVAVLPLLFVSTVLGVAALLLVLGAAVGPTLITMYSLAERQVSARRTGVTLTLISAASVVGYAIGSSLGGHFAQANGPGAAFAVSLVAIATGAAVALQLRLASRRQERRQLLERVDLRSI